MLSVDDVAGGGRGVRSGNDIGQKPGRSGRHDVCVLVALCALLLIAGPAMAQSRSPDMLMSMQWAAVTDPDQWVRMLEPLIQSTEEILALANEMTAIVMKWVGQFGGSGDQSVTDMLGQPFVDGLSMLKALMQKIEQELIPALKT